MKQNTQYNMHSPPFILKNASAPLVIHFVRRKAEPSLTTAQAPWDPMADPAFPVSLADPVLVALPAGPGLQEQTVPTVPTAPRDSTGSLARGEVPVPRVYRARLGQRVMQAPRATRDPAGRLVPGVRQGPLVRPESLASTHKHACGQGLHGHGQVWPWDPRVDGTSEGVCFHITSSPGRRGGLARGEKSRSIEQTRFIRRTIS
jgi:hypothetical protein